MQTPDENNTQTVNEMKRNEHRFSRLVIKSYAVILIVPIISFIIGLLYVKDNGLAALPLIALLFLGNAIVVSVSLSTLLVASIAYLLRSRSNNVWKIVAIASAILAGGALITLVQYIIRLANGGY